MASGDVQRAWFPEMLKELNRFWSSDVSWNDFAIFARHMTEERTKIKKTKSIKPIQEKCLKCGGQMDLLPISIRSCLFALRKTKIIDEEKYKQLDKDWNRHRRKNGLDA